MGFNNAIAKLPESDFQFLLKNGKRTTSLLGYDFNSLIYCSYEFLKETLPELTKKGNFEELVLKMFIDRGIQQFPCDIERIDPNQMMSFVFWIMDESAAITKMESDFLVSEPDPDMMAAGINEMQIFGDLPTIHSLSGGDPTKHKDIKKMPYREIFDLQYMQIVQNRIEKKLVKLKQKKGGRS